MFILNPYTAKPNTIIGGVGSVITTKSALATKLGISESIIKKFEVVGSDVYCRINESYSISVPAFNSDSDLTHYVDYDGKLTSLNSSAVFNDTPNFTSFIAPNLVNVQLNGLRYSGLVNVDLPNLTSAGTSIFEGCTALLSCHLPELTSIPSRIFYNSTALQVVSLMSATTGSNRMFYNTKIVELDLPEMVNISSQTATFRQMTDCISINMPKLRTLGSASVHDDCFTALRANCLIKVNVFMATSNSGSPQAALVWAKANRSATVEFYDDSGSYVSTL